MKRIMVILILVLHSQGNGAVAARHTLPRELIGSHSGAMGQFGRAAEDGSILFYENDCTLGGLEFKPDGTLIVPFAEKGGEFERLQFKAIEKQIPGAMTIWEPLTIGEIEYSAVLFRYGKVFRVLVKLHRGDRAVSGIQWICAESTMAEQRPGADAARPRRTD